MNIFYPTPTEFLKYSEQIYSLLEKSDKEFVPPLSSRCSTTQKSFSSQKNSGIDLYFSELKKQKFLILECDGAVAGFVSYRENHETEDITPAFLPDIYISTVIVNPLFRGKGVAKKMYRSLFNEYGTHFIFTRTWSGNHAHIGLLDYFGFEVFRVYKNDRGENIDTIYFMKRPSAL